MPIKSFRGNLTDGEIETIRLTTNNGLTGYYIRKFELIAEQPMAVDQESVVQIFSVEQTTASAVIDFNNPLLLAAGQIANATSGYYNTGYDQIIFDNVAINQDIYVTHKDNHGSGACNYDLDLEQVKLDNDEAAVATLKDIRGTN